MVEVAVRIERAFRLPASPDAAWALLADVPRWSRLYPHVEAVDPLPEAGPGVFRTTMTPLGPPGGRVRVVYACRYTADPEALALVWTPVEGVGTGRFDGEVRLRPEAGVTAGTLRLGAVLQIPAPSFVRGIVGPSVRAEMERMTDTFLGRLGHVWDHGEVSAPGDV